MPRNDGKESLDTLYEGRLRIFQNTKGYRFSIDALLLAHFVRPSREDRVVELGTGCGVISLILLYRRKVRRITCVEIQSSLCALARRNAVLNRMGSKMKIWEKDLKDLATPARRRTFDLVIMNPPYRKVGSGRVNPHLEKAVARHEFQASLEDVLRVAGHLLRDQGRLVMIYPASRSAEMIREMARNHLEPKRMQWVHSHPGDEGRFLLIESLKEGRAQVQVLPPFFLYDSAGNYTPAAREIFC